jgi:hypothetical protein
VTALQPVRTKSVSFFNPPPVPDPKLLPLGVVHSWASKTVGALVKPLSRKRLILKLSAALKIAQDHQANGLPAGSAEYSQIYQQCLNLIDAYVDTWGVDRDELIVQMPALGALERMTHAVVIHPKAAAPYVLLGFIALIVLPVLAGLVTGVYGVVHAFIIHLFGGS